MALTEEAREAWGSFYTALWSYLIVSSLGKTNIKKYGSHSPCLPRADDNVTGNTDLNPVPSSSLMH